MGSHFDPVNYAQLKHAYGLDQPFFVQYWHFLTGLFRLDFGYSFEYQNRAVWDILKDGVPISAELGFWALGLESLVGRPRTVLSSLEASNGIERGNMGPSLRRCSRSL